MIDATIIKSALDDPSEKIKALPDSLKRWFAVSVFRDCCAIGLFRARAGYNTDLYTACSKMIRACADAEVETVEEGEESLYLAEMRKLWPDLADDPLKAATRMQGAARLNQRAKMRATILLDYLTQVYAFCGDRSVGLLYDGTCPLPSPLDEIGDDD